MCTDVFTHVAEVREPPRRLALIFHFVGEATSCCLPLQTIGWAPWSMSLLSLLPSQQRRAGITGVCHPRVFVFTMQTLYPASHPPDLAFYLESFV